MEEKRKKIPKEEAYEIFVKALEIAKIPCAEQFDESGNVLLKPREMWHEDLKNQIANLFPEINKYTNYGSYLKDKFNTIKRYMYSHDVHNFSYQVDQFAPLINYAKERLATATSRTFSGTILLSRKKFSPLNIWREPDHGTIIRYERTARFQGQDQNLTFAIPDKQSLIAMPPFSGEWLKISDSSTPTYLAIGDQNGQILPIQALCDFLS